jgi:hypothetical protein
MDMIPLFHHQEVRSVEYAAAGQARVSELQGGRFLEGGLPDGSTEELLAIPRGSCG